METDLVNCGFVAEALIAYLMDKGPATTQLVLWTADQSLTFSGKIRVARIMP